MEEHISPRNRPSALARLLAKCPRLARYTVVGVSMYPTLAPGDRLLILRPARTVRTGDLVLAHRVDTPGLEVVKRVVAVTGPRGRRRYVLLGDNPNASTDSRSFGSVERGAISGRVLLRYWPDARKGRVR